MSAVVWHVVHPNGYVSPAYDHIPRQLMRDSRGSIAVSNDGMKVVDVREWTGLSWRGLDGGDRERALDWVAGVLGNRTNHAEATRG